MIVAKAVRMAEMMHVPVIGLVENYSYFRCPDCGKCHQIFGKSHLDETAQAYHLPVLARLPIDPPWRRPAMRAVSNRSTRRSSSLPCRPSSRAEAPFPRNYFPIQGNERRTGAVYIEETVRRKTRGTFSAG